MPRRESRASGPRRTDDDYLSRALQGELGRCEDVATAQYPAPPAEGRWGRVLGRVRDLLEERRDRGGRS